MLQVSLQSRKNQCRGTKSAAEWVLEEERAADLPGRQGWRGCSLISAREQEKTEERRGQEGKHTSNKFEEKKRAHNMKEGKPAGGKGRNMVPYLCRNPGAGSEQWREWRRGCGCGVWGELQHVPCSGGCCSCLSWQARRGQGRIACGSRGENHGAIHVQASS